MAARPRWHRLAVLSASAALLAGCAFTEHLVDKSKFFTPQMRLNDFLPDGGLPDITMQIVPEIWAGGAGGGAAGACWSCGCRRPGLPGTGLAFWPFEFGELPDDYFTGLADWLSVLGAPAPLAGVEVADGQEEVAGPQEAQENPAANADDTAGKAPLADAEPGQPPASDEPPVFVDKGEKDVAPAQKKRRELLLDIRGTGVFDKPTAPALVGTADQLYYFRFTYGLTSNSSLWLEAVDAEYAPPEDVSDPHLPDTLWTRVLWERLTTKASKTQLEFGSRWINGAQSGVRAAGAYIWDVGFNLNLTARLHVSQLDNLWAGQVEQWGGQVDMEAQAAITPDTCLWARGSYYWAMGSRSEAAKFSAGMARHLGSGTGIHVGAYLGNARYVDEVAGITAASSAFARVEVRQMLHSAGTLLRGGYVWYFDSWDTTADSTFFKVERWFGNGLIGAGYRYYATSEGYEAGTWIASAEYKW